jgi:predicted lipoprotein with Yx(FWY)xxD motif
MKQRARLPLYVAAAAGVSALAALFGLTQSQSGASSSVTTSPTSTVIATRDTSLGTVLVDQQGRAMYVFAKDTGPTSNCQGSCAAAWPPVPVTGTPHVAGSANAASVGVIARPSDGQRQLSYAGHPLYYFAGDSQPGQTHGEGLNEFGAKWYAVDATGNAVVTAPGRTSGGNGGAGSGYGY